ncbi:unnamed protein product [Symbiodinium necroappetens]|uniref:protein-serine/threonine phosphatase n=1 Tax=Symbiodinium necroappetens TaxID=1628268 RepID=A0A812L2U1_9DINO|nr:unnamed protein product [Symbiodinium necroappetens]
MRRQFQEQDSRVRTWAGRAYTDDELSRRFDQTATGSDDGLMDEEAARRLVARERESSQSDLMDEATVKRKLAEERAREREKDAVDAEEARRAAAARAACQDSSDESSRSRSRSRSRTEPPRPASKPVSFEPLSGEGDGLQSGAMVMLTNLKQAAALNGSRGKLERFDAASGRWEVKLLASGDVKAIRPDNLLPAPDTEDASAAPSSPVPEIAPRSPPPAPELTGRAQGAAASRVAAPAPAPKPARRMGTVRWYNGRRKLGAVIPDGPADATDLFIPAQGAPNGSQVPPQPGGLFHGTRVSFLPMTIKSEAANGKQKTEVARSEVRPLAGQKGLLCGVDTNAGAKERNDDRIAAQDLHELGFLSGIFDGHRGGSCAEFAAKQVPPNVLSAYRTRAKREGSLVKLSAEKEAALIAEALAESFEVTDKAWLVAARKKDLQEGSTGIVALVSHGFAAPVEAKLAEGCAALWPKPKEAPEKEKRPGTVARAPGGIAKLFVAWAGDCRCVLLRGRQGLRISEDHRPQRADEKRRVEKAGGLVVRDAHKVWRVGPRPDNKFAKELQKGKKDGQQMSVFLSTCRGFGDPTFKSPDPIVIVTPDVKTVDLVPEDWACVLGSDGVFDALSDQEVADVVWRAMAGHGKDAVRAAKEVVQTALRKGSRDNVTAVICRFGWATPPEMDSTVAAVISSSGLENTAFTAPVEPSDDVNMFG